MTHQNSPGWVSTIFFLNNRYEFILDEFTKVACITRWRWTLMLFLHRFFYIFAANGRQIYISSGKRLPERFYRIVIFSIANADNHRIGCTSAPCHWANNIRDHAEVPIAVEHIYGRPFGRRVVEGPAFDR